MNFNFQKARELMVENQLRPNKINNQIILELFKNIKKEKSLPMGQRFSMTLLWQGLKCLQKMAPQAGLEPATQRLTVVCSTNWATGEHLKVIS